jgi:hypothetical protein
MGKSNRGFTLFEVLGAVSLLAIVYMLLASVTFQGLRSEAHSQRILKASMLADLELGEFEAKIDQGEVPELGITEGEEDEDGFVVTWEVTALEAPSRIEGARLPSKEEVAIFDAVFTPAPESDPPFVQVQLTVSWRAAGQERKVTRTTFAVDHAAATEHVARSGLLVYGNGMDPDEDTLGEGSTLDDDPAPPGDPESDE